MDLVPGALLVCGPWRDEYASKGGVRHDCILCNCYVVAGKENEENVKKFQLKTICHPCLMLGEILGFQPQMGGYLMGGETIDPEKWNPAKKGV